MIATKAGSSAPGRGGWESNGDPGLPEARVRGQPERLKLDRIDLYQLHRIDSKVPVEDQIGAFIELRDEGKIRHIGLSEVSVEQLTQVRER